MFNQPQHQPRPRHLPPFPIRQPQTFPQAPIRLDKRLILPNNAGVPLHGPVYAASMPSLLGPAPGIRRWARSIAGLYCGTQQGLPHRRRSPLRKETVDGEQHSRSSAQDLAEQHSRSSAQDLAEQHSRSSAQYLAEQHNRSSAQDLGVQHSRFSAQDLGEQHSRSSAQDLGEQHSRSSAQDLAEEHSRSSAQDLAEQHSRSSAQDLAEQHSRSSVQDLGVQQESDLKRQTVNRSDKSGEVTHEVRLLRSADQPGSGASREAACAVLPPDQEEAADCSCVETQITAAELQVNRPSLKVTIQRSSESREFQQTGRVTETPCEGLHCHLCNITCYKPQHFQGHMMGAEHQRRLMDIQHISSVCLRRRRPSMQRWCATCQSHFSGDLILHRRTNQHKLCKQASRPFCSVCKRHFRNPRKFVEHMKSPDHKQQQEQLCQEETLEEELITVDAVGCFEEECP